MTTLELDASAWVAANELHSGELSSLEHESVSQLATQLVLTDPYRRRYIAC